MANAQTYREVWQVCLDRIQKHTTQEEFAKWFEPLKPLSFDGTNLRLKVPDGSHAKHIEDNYLNTLHKQTPETLPIRSLFPD